MSVNLIFYVDEIGDESSIDDRDLVRNRAAVRSVFRSAERGIVVIMFVSLWVAVFPGDDFDSGIDRDAGRNEASISWIFGVRDGVWNRRLDDFPDDRARRIHAARRADRAHDSIYVVKNR